MKSSYLLFVLCLLPSFAAANPFFVTFSGTVGGEVRNFGARPGFVHTQKEQDFRAAVDTGSTFNIVFQYDENRAADTYRPFRSSQTGEYAVTLVSGTIGSFTLDSTFEATLTLGQRQQTLSRPIRIAVFDSARLEIKDTASNIGFLFEGFYPEGVDSIPDPAVMPPIETFLMQLGGNAEANIRGNDGSPEFIFHQGAFGATAVAIPEPGTLVLAFVGLGAVALLLRRRS